MSGKSSASKPKKRLLLADDSATIQKVVNLTFANENIELITVGDGDALMEKFVEATPDLVLIDVNMPGADGYKICEIIKQDEETSHIPVILLVGNSEQFDEAEARRVGADDSFKKPFQSINRLYARVSVLLDPNYSSAEQDDSNNQTDVADELSSPAKAETESIPDVKSEVYAEPNSNADEKLIAVRANAALDALLPPQTIYSDANGKTYQSIADAPQMPNISPEIIEQIAARVVEKLSERAAGELRREKSLKMSDLIAKELSEEKQENV